MAMAKKTTESSKIVVSGTVRPARYPNSVKVQNKKGSPSPTNGELTPQRQSPVVQSPQGSSRTSPGLLAGHYAGCKFSEPPSPSALPLPPQHWMQSPHIAVMPFHMAKTGQLDIAQQLKVLLKVQA